MTGGSSIPVFSGQLGGFGSRPLGAIGPGEARAFRFTASRPDMDNAFAGSALTVRYAWNASVAGTEPGPGEQPVATFKLNSKEAADSPHPRRDRQLQHRRAVVKVKLGLSPAAGESSASCTKQATVRAPRKRARR